MHSYYISLTVPYAVLHYSLVAILKSVAKDASLGRAEERHGRGREASRAVIWVGTGEVRDKGASLVCSTESLV